MIKFVKETLQVKFFIEEKLKSSWSKEKKICYLVSTFIKKTAIRDLFPSPRYAQKTGWKYLF